MDYTEILYDVAEGVATITLNRPEKMNAFSTRMIAEWTDALETARDDDGVRAVIVTGAGRGFCSGMDVAAEAESLMDETRAFCARLAEGPAVAIQLAKRLAYRSMDATLDQALDLAQSAMVISQSTEDAKEGPRAFTERRKPNFQGR